MKNKTDIKKIKTWLPVFTGFYHSIFEPRCPLDEERLKSGFKKHLKKVV